MPVKLKQWKTEGNNRRTHHRSFNVEVSVERYISRGKSNGFLACAQVPKQKHFVRDQALFREMGRKSNATDYCSSGKAPRRAIANALTGLARGLRNSRSSAFRGTR